MPPDIAKSGVFKFSPNFYNVNKQMSVKKRKTVYTLRVQKVTTTGEFFIETSSPPSNIASEKSVTFDVLRWLFIRKWTGFSSLCTQASKPQKKSKTNPKLATALGV